MKISKVSKNVCCLMHYTDTDFIMLVVEICDLVVKMLILMWVLASEYF